MANTVVLLEQHLDLDHDQDDVYLTIISNGYFYETNEFKILGSEVVVKVRPHANAAIAGQGGLTAVSQTQP